MRKQASSTAEDLISIRVPKKLAGQKGGPCRRRRVRRSKAPSHRNQTTRWRRYRAVMPILPSRPDEALSHL